MDECVKIVDKIIEINEHRIKLKFIRIYQTFMIWIGDPLEPKLNSLSLSFGNNVSTSIIDDMEQQQFNSIINQEMANKLSNSFNNNRPVYVSYNYPPAIIDSELKLKIDKKLLEFIHENISN